jgi:hypothetical protein
MVSHVQFTEEGALCRGEVCIHILLTREGEGERPRKMIRKIPFAETIAIGNTLPRGSQIVGVRATGVCPTITATANDDSIELEGTVMLSAEVAAVSEISYIKDAYSKTSDCESSHRKLTILSPIACWGGNVTVNAGKDLSELSLDSGMRLCDIRASLLPDIKTEIGEDGRFTASGKVKISAIADNGAELIPAEFETDMKYTADIRKDVRTLPLKTSLTATVSEVKGRIDSDRLACDCEICISCLIDKEQEIDVIDEINLTPSSFLQSDASRIRICYPAIDESLWDIAKRYRTDSGIIAEKNSLEPTPSPDSEDSLKNAKFLII